MNNSLKNNLFFINILIIASIFLSACRQSQPISDAELNVLKNTILIVNSDKSVEKYATIQREFEKELFESELNLFEFNLAEENSQQSVFDLNLAEKNSSQSAFEKKLSTVRPALVYTVGSKAYTLASNSVKDKPLVFSSMINWQRFNITENTYGITLELPTEMQLFMYSYLFPEIRTLGVLYSKSHNNQWFENAVPQAKEVGLSLQGKMIENKGDISAALKKLLPKVDALWLISDPIVLYDAAQIQEIFETAEARKKPIFAYNTLFSQYGAMLTISADIPTMGRQAANLVQNIVEKQVIDESEKVQLPAGSHITLNLKKAKEYGVKINPTALSSVENIIQ